MSSNDGGPTPKRSILSKLSGRQTPPELGEDQMLDEVIARAVSGSHALRKEAAEWRAKATELDAELRTIKHELEAKLSAARNENTLLRKQLDDVGAKMERYLGRSLELTTKTNDLELFQRTEMERLSEAAKLCAQGILSAVASSVHTMTAFLDDLHKAREAGEYRAAGSAAPRTGTAAPEVKPPLPDDQMTPEATERLTRLAAMLAPKPVEENAP